MKRKLLLLAVALLSLISCSKSSVTALPEGEEVTVSLVAAVSGNEVTKASFDGDGAGIYADQCRLQIWWGDVLFYDKTAPVSGLKAKFDDIVLIKDQSYDFLFWADNAEGAYYVTDKLTEVKLAGTYVGGDDKRDAFYAALVGKTVTRGFSETVELHRPFAQLNVITVDIPALHGQIPNASQFASVVPDKVSLSVTVPTVFNVKTGVASSPEELSYTAPVYTSPYKTSEGAKNTLSMDYLFAPSEEGNVVELKFSAKNETSGLADIDYNFSNIPLRRNYRTNVIGSLVTVTGTVNVVIEPTWCGEIYY